MIFNNLGDDSTKDLEFLKSLTNCSRLQVISISNNFVGSLSNHLSGQIPSELGNLIVLTLFSMELNHFEGVIPTTFGKFEKMQELELKVNK
jgi:Ran GTPase-activating protein (RanGAP) involved in mRNA processing and transport